MLLGVKSCKVLEDRSFYAHPQDMTKYTRKHVEGCRLALHACGCPRIAQSGLRVNCGQKCVSAQPGINMWPSVGHRTRKENHTRPRRTGPAMEAPVETSPKVKEALVQSAHKIFLDSLADLWSLKVTVGPLK